MHPTGGAFLKVLTAGSAALGRLASSQRRATRWLRRNAEDSRRSVLPAPSTPAPGAWSDDDITVAWLGHATVLVNFFGILILTDPALVSRVGLSLGFGTAGPKRYVAPALRLEELPPIDLLLLSHAHMDHLDLATLRRLSRAIPTVSAKVTQDLLVKARHPSVLELGWNERRTLRLPKGELEIEAFEVKHWGQRWPRELARGYNGYVLRREGKALVFGGDTAFTATFRDIRSQGPVALAIMPIGAYRPWIWNHCTPEQAAEMANLAGAQFILPIHHQTFKLSDEPMREPIERLQQALATEPERLGWRQIGETFVYPG